MNGKTKRVIIGLSGGVDSSVAAFMLLQEGYEVEGLFMKNWEEDDSDDYCPSAQDLHDAQMICDILNIKLHTVNFSNEYWDHVFEHCLTELRQGRTPNPDVLCNREIKFKAFYNYALQLGADYIATGHYAQIKHASNCYYLHRARDQNKDQTYFLYNLEQPILAKTLFPIGHVTKPEVRKIAIEKKLPNANKKDSTGICFIGKRKFKQFITKYLPLQPGPIVTPDRTIVGQHDGLMFYTLGQRQGLMIGGHADYSGLPWYVVGKDLTENTLIVAQGDSHPLLYKQSLETAGVHWITKHNPSEQFACTAKIRYRQMDVPCHLAALGENAYKVTFENPERSVTPGQSIVFYQQEICLGGGIIQ